MNKAITDGLALMPPPFENGLDVWSRGDGTAGTPTYDGLATAAILPTDADFGSCLELLKTETPQRLRSMGQTPILPGCYLRITARVKAVSGSLPTVQISAFAAGAGDVALSGVTTVGPATTLSAYGEVVEVSAIVGTGARPGVDMPWGDAALYGHFGIDLTGPDGGVIRVDDLEIEDVTSVFLRTLMDWVDVKDFGAVGDGVTDNTAAFEAADAAANGRTVLVSDGVFALSDNVTFENDVRFQGTLTMPADKHLGLRQNFDFDSYSDAFGDETLGFKKAFQALLKYSDHEGLDLCGRSIALTEPIDMQAAVPDVTTFANRRVIRNGQFDAVDGPAWVAGSATSQATYAISNPLQLTAVSNVANIEVGSLITGAGVGREVYVTERNVGAQTLTISQPLYDAAGTQTYTFTRYRYMLDFSGFESLSRLNISDVEFKCDGFASAVMLSKQGLIWHFRDCFFNKPKDRGITSIGRACQGMLIDCCQFLSNEQQLLAQDRTSIGFNINANDVKLRDNRAVRFGHWAVMKGSGHLIQGNHWFQGDEASNATRQAGLILTQTNSKIVITGNYIDNCFIEWNNEHDAEPEFSGELGFGSLSITGNIFTATRVGAWFRFIVVKPYGPDHFINGLNVSGNTFKVVDGSIDRVDKLDDSIATLDLGRSRNINWTGNTSHAVNQWTASPAMLQINQATPATSWTCDFSGWMPFGGRARNVTGIVAVGALRDVSNATDHATPYSTPEQGSDGAEVALVWPRALKGKVNVTARMDNPF
ncbi:MAG: right-handed parallel beta-helix repeat-containing protein [Paracoccaceae bacterium]